MLLIICVIISCLNVMAVGYKKGNLRVFDVNTQKQMIEYIDKNNYDYVMATFWLGNSTIELSNGKIKPILIKESPVLEKYNWLTTNEKLDYSFEGRVCLLATSIDVGQYYDNYEDYIAWTGEGIYVFRFDSVRQAEKIFKENHSK